MNSTMRIKRPLPPAPKPTKAFKSSEYQVCLDGTVIRRTRLSNVTDLHLAVTPQTKASSYAERNKGAFSKWEQMAQMARSNVGIKDLMEVTGKSRPGVSNNLNGRGKFSADEAILIRNNLFPKLTIDYLFSPDAVVTDDEGKT